jgi:hypothetical protein
MTRGCPKEFIKLNPNHAYVEVGAIDQTFIVIERGDHSPFHSPVIGFSEFHKFSTASNSPIN